MSILINLAIVLSGIIIIIGIIRLIVIQKMSEAQAVLWLLIGVITVIVGVFPSIIPALAEKLNIWYPPTIVFVLVSLVLIFIVLSNTIIISEQKNKINELFIQTALLDKEIEQLKARLDGENK